MAEVGLLKERLPQDEAAVREIEAELDAALAMVPKVPLADVPFGRDESDNVEVRRVGAVPHFDFPCSAFRDRRSPRLMDFEAAAKLSGARFVVLKGDLARLERALAQFMLDLHTGSTATPKWRRRFWCATR